MKFSMKKFTSLSLGFSFLIMSCTGVMLYFVPHGRVAYWSNWHLFGLTKTQYGDIHTTSMVVFLFFAFLHVYYNFKPIVSYLKNKDKKISFSKAEFLMALGINLFVIIGTFYMIQPFKGYLDLEENVKEYWTKQYGEPPCGHAEETKLKVFCKKMNIDFNKTTAILNKNNINFKDNDSLLVIAKNNNMSPQNIFELINNFQKNKTYSGLGRKTLQELSDLGDIDLAYALKILNLKGLKAISKDDKIKNIADELDMTPIDVFNMINGK